MVIALALVAGAGCARTFRAQVSQPNPLVHPTETLRDSEQVEIVTGDMELERPVATSSYERAAPSNMVQEPLENVASFTMVSRDRLRFHLQLEHKWQDWADPQNWDVFLIDDKGRRYNPESIEHAHTAMLTQMWDQEQDSVVKDEYGDIVAINDDGWKRREALGSLSVFRGRADFVFYQRDLFTKDIKWMKLVVRRPGMGFEFRWNFDDNVVADSGE
jgi:hypothetical protein